MLRFSSRLSSLTQYGYKKKVKLTYLPQMDINRSTTSIMFGLTNYIKFDISLLDYVYFHYFVCFRGGTFDKTMATRPCNLYIDQLIRNVSTKIRKKNQPELVELASIQNQPFTACRILILKS
jgi:hypothetical protein